MQGADQLPESLIVGEFSGVRNVVAPERLRPGELEAGVNIDIDDAGQPRRRRGYSLKDAANYHSARTIARRTLAVRNEVLGELRADYSFTPFGWVGPHPVAYVAVGTTIYFSSSTASGKVVGDTIEPWGTLSGAGTWVSPVMRPTDTFGAVSGQLLGNVPTATELEYYKGRIYLGHEKVLWTTELYLYDLVDRVRGFMHFEHNITMIEAVDDGLYVGTEAQLLFLQGTHAEGLKMTVILEEPVVRGSAVDVPVAEAHPQAKNGPVPEGVAPMFLTGAGICLGLENGQVHNLTRGRVVFPAAERAAALYRGDQGANAYVAVMDSAGEPEAAARIGDYVEAEIVRASQRG